MEKLHDPINQPSAKIIHGRIRSTKILQKENEMLQRPTNLMTGQQYILCITDITGTLEYFFVHMYAHSDTRQKFLIIISKCCSKVFRFKFTMCHSNLLQKLSCPSPCLDIRFKCLCHQREKVRLMRIVHVVNLTFYFKLSILHR